MKNRPKSACWWKILSIKKSIRRRAMKEGVHHQWIVKRMCLSGVICSQLRRHQTSWILIWLFRSDVLIVFWTLFFDIWFIICPHLCLNFNFIFADQVKDFFSFVMTTVSFPLRLVSGRPFFLVCFAKKSDLFEHNFERRWIDLYLFFWNGQTAQDFAFETLNKMDKYSGLTYWWPGTQEANCRAVLQ